jgi:hypothetical protein
MQDTIQTGMQDAVQDAVQVSTKAALAEEFHTSAVEAYEQERMDADAKGEPLPHDAREARIKELEEQIAVSQFRSVLQSPDARRRTGRLLEKFQKGTMMYEEYMTMDPMAQRLYRQMHGERPKRTDEIARATKAKAKRKMRNRLRKQGRKTSKRAK